MAPTYPDINGEFIPDSLFRGDSWLLTVNFLHRHIPLLIVLIAVVGWVMRPTPLKTILMGMLPIQFTLGVLTVLFSKGGIPVGMGVLHQLVGWLMMGTVFAGLTGVFSSGDVES